MPHRLCGRQPVVAGHSYIAADYVALGGPTNAVQWLEPDDVTAVGSPFSGTATNLSNPPAASVYNLSSITRTLVSPTLNLKIK